MNRYGIITQAKLGLSHLSDGMGVGMGRDRDGMRMEMEMG